MLLLDSAAGCSRVCLYRLPRENLERVLGMALPSRATSAVEDISAECCICYAYRLLLPDAAPGAPGLCGSHFVKDFANMHPGPVRRLLSWCVGLNGIYYLASSAQSSYMESLHAILAGMCLIGQ